MAASKRVAIKFLKKLRANLAPRPNAKAQLSQRDRATFRVIEYFAKSLKVTEGHSK